jgi:hypothetical protein
MPPPPNRTHLAIGRAAAAAGRTAAAAGRTAIVAGALVAACALTVACALALAGCSNQAASPAAASSAAASASAGQTLGSPTSALPALSHIFIILMENESGRRIIGNPDAPFINGLADHYSLATDYSALYHPSLPNYIALTSGSNQGITDDRSPPSAGYAVNATNIADRIEASGRTWKLYGENMPAPGYANNAHLYATRHIPFLYYKDILDNAARRKSHVVPYTQLAADLRSASTTPDYAFITPNTVDDMHDAPIAVGDTWLARNVPLILRSPAFASSRSLLVITWDEGSAGDNHVATIFAGSAARLGYRSIRPYDHYSLLHTIEADWHLQPLTANDAQAVTMGEFLR